MVVIPIQVIEEVDHFKKEMSEIGRSARTVSRYLDALRVKGSLADGVPTDDGGTILVHLGVDVPEKFPITERNADAKILAVALALKQQRKTVVFITKDTNLRVKADALGVSAVDYETDYKNIEEVYRGWRDVPAPRETIDRFYKESAMTPERARSAGTLYPNEFVRLSADGERGRAERAGSLPRGGVEDLLLRDMRTVWGIRPRNMEQRFAMDAAARRQRLARLADRQGGDRQDAARPRGGAAARRSTTRSTASCSSRVRSFRWGATSATCPARSARSSSPGCSRSSTTSSCSSHLSTGEKRGRGYLTLLDQKLIEIEPLTYIRGRSIPHQFLIVDEAQNLTPHEVKTILTRAGEKTRSS